MEAATVVQGVFDFESGNPNGFQNWQAEQERRLQAIRQEWNLPVGRRVRLKLRTFGAEFIGQLRLRVHPTTIDRRAPLHLHIENIEFVHGEIESCVVTD